MSDSETILRRSFLLRIEIFLTFQVQLSRKNSFYSARRETARPPAKLGKLRNGRKIKSREEKSGKNALLVIPTVSGMTMRLI